MSFAPPDPAREPIADSGDAPRPGDLTMSWRVMLGLGWIAAFFAYAGVWQASVQIGISTWWVGPRAQPTNVVVKLVPFVLALTVALIVVYNVAHVVRWSAGGVAAAALISVPDFSRSLGLGVAEAIVAGLLAVITLASLSGRYRTAPATTEPRTPDPSAVATPDPLPPPPPPPPQQPQPQPSEPAS